MKNEENKGTSIAYQNKDIVSKVFGEKMRHKSLNVYGLDVPRVVKVLPTNLPIVEANELRIDNLFLLEDESVAIIDYESVYKEENILKYFSYIVRVLRRCYKEEKIFPKVRMIVIYTADIKLGQTQNVLDIGCLKLEIQEAFLSKIPSEEVRQRLQIHIENGKGLTEEETMEYIILPLTYVGREEQQKSIRELVDLSEKIVDEEIRTFVLMGLLVFSDKIIDAETAKVIQRRIAMTKVGQLFEQEKIEYAKAEVQKAKEETAREMVRATARKMLSSNEFTDEKIAEFLPNLSLSDIQALREEMNYNS